MSVSISVIIPVYNAERFLGRCIDSILSQTFHDFELLLIDDGSTDNSLELCNDYALNDQRIAVFHQPNGGVSSARNHGIRKAKGKHIVFIDSDDWVDPDYLETVIPKKDEQLCCCSFLVEDNKSYGHDWNVLLTDTDDTTTALSENLTNFSFCSVTCKTFLRSIITQHDVHFHTDISQCEDAMFVFDYICACKCDIRTQSKATYHYRYDSKPRGSYALFPMHESYKLMALITDRLNRIEHIYGCDNITMLRNEMICSQTYNIIRSIKDQKGCLLQKLKKTFHLIKNEHTRTLLTDKSFMTNRRGGIILYHLMRVFYIFC